MAFPLVARRLYEVRVDKTSRCPVFQDVTYCHLCASQSLIGFRNKGSLVPVVDTFEKQPNLCYQISSLLIVMMIEWRTPISSTLVRYFEEFHEDRVQLCVE